MIVRHELASEHVTKGLYSKYKALPQPFGRSHEPSLTLANWL